MVTTMDGYGVTNCELMIAEPKLEACYKPQSMLHWYLEHHLGPNSNSGGYAIPDYIYNYNEKPIPSTGELVLPYTVEYLNDFLLAILNDATGVVCPFDGQMPHQNVNTGIWYTKNHHQPPTKPKTAPDYPGQLLFCDLF